MRQSNPVSTFRGKSDGWMGPPQQPDVLDRDRAAARYAVFKILCRPAVQSEVRALRKYLLPTAPRVASSAPDLVSAQPQQDQLRAFPSSRDHVPLVDAATQDVVEQMLLAASCVHPAETVATRVGPDVQAAVDFLASLRGPFFSSMVAGRRERFLRDVAQAKLRLAPLEAEVQSLIPSHIARMERPLPVCIFHVLCEAAGIPDKTVALDFATGFLAVGGIPASGWWRPEEDPAYLTEARWEGLAHAAWNDRLEARVVRDYEAADDTSEYEALACKTMQEVALGNMRGPFTRAEIDAAFGPSAFRAMHRFAVWQKGKLRACDNAKGSWHNRAVGRHERLSVEAADFPARVTACVTAAFNEPLEMVSGCDDLPHAYREVPSADPRWTPVCIFVPGVGARYFTMPGFNFGLAAAVPQFNRFPEAVQAIARRLAAVLTCHFFDDFNVTEPRLCAGSGAAYFAPIAAPA